MDYKSINSQIMKIYEVKEWTHIQYDLYKTLKQYVDQFKTEFKKNELHDDKAIIRNNIKEQYWFDQSKSKPIISQLLDRMQLIIHEYTHNEYDLHFYVLLNFGSFQLHGNMYRNFLNGCVNYYICVENTCDHNKAYLTYYVQMNGVEVSQDIKKMKLPEFNKIYDIIGISQNILYQCDLLNLFMEIIMYFDESETIGDIPIGNGINVSLNQLSKKFIEYITQKKSAVDFNIIKDTTTTTSS